MLLSWDKSTWFAAVLHLWQNLAPSVSTALHFEGHALLRCNTRDVALVSSLFILPDGPGGVRDQFCFSFGGGEVGLGPSASYALSASRMLVCVMREAEEFIQSSQQTGPYIVSR